MNQTKYIGNLCTDCHRDTSFGSGLFVNRIPSGTETEVGYLCPECQQHECDRCNELIGCDEDIYLEETFERVHEKCASEKELISDIVSLNEYLKSHNLWIYVDDTIHDVTGTYYFRFISDEKLTNGTSPASAQKSSISFAEISYFDDKTPDEWIKECTTVFMDYLVELRRLKEEETPETEEPSTLAPIPVTEITKAQLDELGLDSKEYSSLVKSLKFGMEQEQKAIDEDQS